TTSGPREISCFTSAAGTMATAAATCTIIAWSRVCSTCMVRPTHPDQLILSRQSLSPIYGRMLNWGRFGSARAQSWERRVGTTSIAVGTTTDSYELQFAHRLAAVADLV